MFLDCTVQYAIMFIFGSTFGQLLAVRLCNYAIVAGVFSGIISIGAIFGHLLAAMCTKLPEDLFSGKLSAYISVGSYLQCCEFSH